MDIRNFPGGPSQAVVVPSKGLREINAFAKAALEQAITDLAVASGALRAYATAATVAAQGSPNMTVKVNPFAAYGGSPLMHGLGFSQHCSGQTGVTFSAIGAGASDSFNALATVTVAAANGSNPRRDLIVFQIQEVELDYAANTKTTVSLAAVNPSTGAAMVPAEFYPNKVQRVALQYVQGTAAASPAQPSVPAGWAPLAEIYVGTGVTSITASNITFVAVEANRGHSLVDIGAFRNQGLCYVTAYGLTVNVKGGNFNIAGSVYAVGDGTLVLTNATTNYVFVNSSGALASNTSGFPDPCIPLATVVTASGTVSSITDKRSWLAPKMSSGGGSGGGSGFPVGMVGGPQPKWISASQLRVPAGFVARSSDDTMNIKVATDQTVDITVSGANGLTAGYAEAVSTWYDLLVIADSSAINAPKGMLVPRGGTITLPVGYDKWADTRTRWRNDSSGNIQASRVRGEEQQYECAFTQSAGVAGPTSVLAAGSSATWADVALGAWVPPDTQEAILHCFNIIHGSLSFLRCKGETHGGTQLSENDDQAHARVDIQTDSSQTIQYYKSAGGNLDIAVRGFMRPPARTS